MATDSRREPLTDLEAPPVQRRRIRDWLKFGLVGASGVIVNQILVVFLTEFVGIYYIASAMLATFGSSTWNFIGADRWAFADRRTNGSARDRYLGFLGLNLVLLGARVPMLWLLTEVIGIHYTISNLVSLVALFALRLLVADVWLWREGPPPIAADPRDAATAAVAGERVARHRYDLAGLLAIESDVELRELRSFTSSRIGPPDIKIRVGLVGTRPARHVTFVERDDELVY